MIHRGSVLRVNFVSSDLENPYSPPSSLESDKEMIVLIECQIVKFTHTVSVIVYTCWMICGPQRDGFWMVLSVKYLHAFLNYFVSLMLLKS